MIKYTDKYPGFIRPADPDTYPFGSAKNSTTDETEDGTPIEEAWVNDINGLLQSIMSISGEEPNGTPDSLANPQVLSSLINLPWSSKITYKTGARVIGSNGKSYKCKKPSGPNTTVSDPVNDSAGEYWTEEPRKATEQEAIDGSEVVAYTTPDLSHKAFNQYGIGAPVYFSVLSEDDTVNPGRVYYTSLNAVEPTASIFSFGGIGSGSLRTSQLIINKDYDRAYIRRHNGDESPATKPKVKIILENDKATTPQAEAALNDNVFLTPYTGGKLIDSYGIIKDFDAVGAVMLCRLVSPTSNASTYPGSALQGVSVGGAETSGRLSGTYRPMGFILANSSDPLERTTVFQKIAD